MSIHDVLTDRDGMKPNAAGLSPERAPAAIFPVLAGYGLLIVALLIVVQWMSGTDYVGPDSDDNMRLVEVRDFLAGQGWFDMMQYRLGLEGGTLMHWSRFIDLPMALLIRFFSLFAGPERAEALALATWPLSLSFAIVCLMGLAGYRAGGRIIMHLAAGMTIFYVYGMGRFEPGSADHHNAQLTLASLVIAMLVDPSRRATSFAIAGMAAAMEIAIGAESVPFVAAACVVVALLWGFEGSAMRRQAMAFGLSLLVTVSLAFLLTVPPRFYSMVTCDNLSLGFYSLASVGGFMLFLSALLITRPSLPFRFGALALTGAALLGTALVIAPQCLGNPLANLDPMLTELWLNNVLEAKSFIAQFRMRPTSIGGLYGMAVIAFVYTLWRLARRRQPALWLLMAVLMAISLAVAAVQVRGTLFANLVAILPMAFLVADLREWQQEKPKSAVRAVVYLGGALLSIPLIWSLIGLFMEKGVNGFRQQVEAAPSSNALACGSGEALQPLASLPKGVVLAPVDFGPWILRFTPHRAISGPYHRNQAGMLTELNTGLAMPEEAIAFLRGAKVTYVLFCPEEAQTQSLARMKPEGFYGALMEGKVPPYLKPMNTPQKGGMQIYRVEG